MGEELEVKMNMPVASQQKGFILVTALIMLSLLTLLSLGMYMSSRSAIQTSAAAQVSTEAYYFAETGINYISWGLTNDAEFDSFAYTGTYIAPKFDEPSLNFRIPSSAASDGDYTELHSYMWDPGPTGLPGATAVDSATRDTAYTAGQVMYFDNSPMGNRAICFQNASNFNACIDVTVDSTSRWHPSMYQISTRLPRYIKLDIAPDGAIVPSIPKLPHRGPTSPPTTGPVVENDQNMDGTYDHNGDVPKNGAIVWLTAASPANLNQDIEIFPLDPAVVPFPPNGAFGGTAPSACAGGTLPNCPCDSAQNVSGNNYSTANACDATNGVWLTSYNIVIYAIGYVNGKPGHMLRAVIVAP